MDYIGYIVSLNCGETLGVYQGQVVRVDTNLQLLTIGRAFRNGLKCDMPEITISARDIQDIKILKSHREAKAIIEKKATPSKVTKPIEKVAACARISPVKQVSKDNLPCPVSIGVGCRESGGRRISGSDDGGRSYQRRTPVSDDGGRGQINCKKPTTPCKSDHQQPTQNRRQTPKPDCFSTPIEGFIDDFDFEKNLALFDKKSSLLEFERLEDGRYRGTEDVLEKHPVILRQITLSTAPWKEFTTDSGLVVPCISPEERIRLHAEAKRCGYSETRLLEIVGRSSSEMIMQLLGGSNRLNPNNRHQLPVVVVLCGPHIQGAQGANCARHLANHNIHTTVFIPPVGHTTSAHLSSELSMYAHTGMATTSDISGLPDVVDLIVYAMDCHEDHPCRGHIWFRMLTEWANHKRTPVFAIDPPQSQVMIHAKWSMILGLPFDIPENLGHLYLCDIGWPKKIFSNCGIKYKSPFGHKFVISLYNNV